MRLYFWIGVIAVAGFYTAVAGIYVYYLSQRHRCVGRSNSEIAGIARQGMVEEFTKEQARGHYLDLPVSPEQGRKARVVQFVRWPKDEGYDVAFQIPGDKAYWDVTVSAACGIHPGRISNIVPPL